MLLSFSYFPENTAWHVLAAFFIFWLGAILASFAITAAQRAVRGESFVKGRSHCDSCQTTLDVAYLFPIISWLALKGRCAFCRAPIPVILPVFEACAAFFFCGLYLTHGFSPVLAGSLILLTPLCYLAVSDIERGIIPDKVLLPLAAAVFLCKWLLGASPLSMLLYGLGAAIFLLGVRWYWKRGRSRIAIGMGDIKLIVLLAFLAEKNIFLLTALAPMLACFSAAWVYCRTAAERNLAAACCEKAPVADAGTGSVAETAAQSDTGAAGTECQAAGTALRTASDARSGEGAGSDDLLPATIPYAPWLIISLVPFAFLV